MVVVTVDLLTTGVEDMTLGLPAPPSRTIAEIIAALWRNEDRKYKTACLVLAKAFAGELVPTEAELAGAEGRTYESGEELLARVRAGRTRADAKATAPKRRLRRVASG